MIDIIYDWRFILFLVGVICQAAVAHFMLHRLWQFHLDSQKKKAEGQTNRDQFIKDYTEHLTEFRATKIDNKRLWEANSSLESKLGEDVKSLYVKISDTDKVITDRMEVKFDNHLNRHHPVSKAGRDEIP